MESKWDKPVGLVTEKLLSHVPGFSDHSRPQGSSGSLFQLEKQRPGKVPQKQSTADRLAQDCHWPPFPLHRPSVSHKREVFTVLCTLLSLALLFGQRHETQPLRFYGMRQGQRCGEGTRDAQEGTVSVSNPASLQEHLSSGDVWHRTQLLTIL